MVNYLHVSLGEQKEIAPGPWHDLVGVGCHAELKSELLFCFNIFLILHVVLSWPEHSSHCGIFVSFLVVP